MRFEESYTYDAPIAKVWQMLSAETFVKARNSNLQIPDPSVSISATDKAIHTVTSGDVPPSMIPPAAQRFLKSGTSFAINEEWNRVNPTEIKGSFKAEGKGVPAHLLASINLVQNASGTTDVKMQGEIKINIPFLGAKLEKQALSFAPQLVQADVKAAADWISAH